MPNGNCLYSLASLPLVGEITHCCMKELRVMPAVKLHVNVTYYAQHSALKSIYGKSQSVIGGKSFSSYRTVFEPAQGLQDSKTSVLRCSYETLL